MVINVETLRAQHAQANPDDMRTWNVLKPLLFDYKFGFGKEEPFSNRAISYSLSLDQKPPLGFGYFSARLAQTGRGAFLG